MALSTAVDIIARDAPGPGVEATQCCEKLAFPDKNTADQVCQKGSRRAADILGGLSAVLAIRAPQLRAAIGAGRVTWFDPAAFDGGIACRHARFAHLIPPGPAGSRARKSGRVKVGEGA